MCDRSPGVPSLTASIAACRMLFICLVTLSITAAVAAQDVEPEGYREAVDEAVREFGARNFEEARSLFARADGLSRNARTQRGLGLTEFELRNYIECIQYFEAALESNVKPLDDALRKETEQLLARARTFVGRFVIEAKPAASQLVVDGLSAPMPTDRTLTLKVGDHYLELYAANYAPEKRLLNVKGGETETLHIDFDRPSSVNGGQAADSSRWYESPWLWVAVGVVVAGATTGIVVAATSSGDNRPSANGGSSRTVIGGP
jgi:tetratricopeptide (TPR) repeat protein